MTGVRVALLPDALDARPRDVCAVVDVIRASTTLVALAEAGDPDIWLARDLASARASRRRWPAAVLCGEHGGAKPEGFDHGNSPREFAHANLRGQRVVMTTTNGTVALWRWRHARRVFVGALRNAGSVARRLVESAAENRGDVTVVCAGRDRELALEDVYTAGAIVRQMLRARPGLELDETAEVALRLHGAYGSTIEALETSRGAKLLKPLGLWTDVAVCAEEDVSTAVPELDGAGRLRLLEDT